MKKVKLGPNKVGWTGTPQQLERDIGEIGNIGKVKVGTAVGERTWANPTTKAKKVGANPSGIDVISDGKP